MPAFNLPEASAQVVICATTAIIWTIFVWHIRLFVRLRINKGIEWDDIYCTIATVLGIASSVLLLVQMKYGLGLHSDSLSAETKDRQLLLAWLSGMLFILAVCFSILSVCFLIARTTRHIGKATPAYVAAGLTALWGVMGTLTIGFRCDLPTPWRARPRTRCINIVRHLLPRTIGPR